MYDVIKDWKVNFGFFSRDDAPGYSRNVADKGLRNWTEFEHEIDVWFGFSKAIHMEILIPSFQLSRSEIMWFQAFEMPTPAKIFSKLQFMAYIDTVGNLKLLQAICCLFETW